MAGRYGRRHTRRPPKSLKRGEAEVELNRTTEPFSLVLADGKGGSEDAFALARHVKEHPEQACGISVVVSTGTSVSILQIIRQLGASYFRKSIRRAELVQALRRESSSWTNSSQPSSRREITADLQTSLPPVKVLLVEDDVFNQRVAAMKLERAGHTVRVVSNGQEALRAVESEQFDLMLTDVQMRGMDGFELTAHVRRWEQTTGGRLPVIAMTAHAMKSDRERCLQGGMDGYVAKPIQDAELWEAMRSALPERSSPSGNGVRPAFDAERVRERVGGSDEQMRQLIEIFRQDYPPLLEEIDRSIREGDAKSLRSAAHTPKSLVAFFSASEATAAALRLESLGESGSIGQARAVYQVLTAEVSRLNPCLESLLTNYSPGSTY